MRLWSIHPKYLDSKGLVALWREALLAKKVLQGKTKGYRNHPQLERFDPKSINSYIASVFEESCKRGYCFDKRKIGKTFKAKIIVSSGQIDYEFRHLKSKLKTRDTKKYKEILKTKRVIPNPIFSVRKGPVEKWEK
jgi:hypothetical protein